MFKKLKTFEVGWKVAYIRSRAETPKLCFIKLMIPKGSVVFSKRGRSQKRTNQALVVEIYDEKGNRNDKITAYSWNDNSYIYKIYRLKTPDYFDLSETMCSGGIHFCKTPRQAYNVMKLSLRSEVKYTFPKI